MSSVFSRLSDSASGLCRSRGACRPGAASRRGALACGLLIGLLPAACATPLAPRPGGHRVTDPTALRPALLDYRGLMHVHSQFSHDSEGSLDDVLGAAHAALTGFPVYTSDDGVETGRQFYGMSMDLLGVFESVDINVFVNQQDVDGLDDRQAMGGELRYFGESGTFITALDYEVGYSEMNSFVALGNWTFDNRVSVNGMLDWRKTPYLTTENALIGQPADNIDELLLSFTEDAIRDLAPDRTGSMQTAAVGISSPLGERFQVSADVTLSKFEGTQESGGVPATPDSDLESYYYLSLVGSSLWRISRPTFRARGAMSVCRGRGRQTSTPWGTSQPHRQQARGHGASV